jgi:hypothetical protein
MIYKGLAGLKPSGNPHGKASRRSLDVEATIARLVLREKIDAAAQGLGVLRRRAGHLSRAPESPGGVARPQVYRFGKKMLAA